MTRPWVALAAPFALALAACGGGPCEDLETQLQACTKYQSPPQMTPTSCPPCTPSPGVTCVACNPTAPQPIPLDCDGSTVNNLAQCILDSGQDLCSHDGLAIANARCNK